MLYKDYKVEDFLYELSSEAPSPGGGSTAALVLGLSASLNSMVYSLTIGKNAYERLKDEEKEKMLTLQKEDKTLILLAQEFKEKDREDFLGLMDTYKLPKSSDEEIKFRKDKIREFTIKAMDTPMKLAEECIRFYDNIEFAVRYGNKNLVSDAGVAASLLHSAIESAIINVKVNLNFLREEEFLDKIEEKCSRIINDSYFKKSNLMKEVDKIIYPK